MCRKQNLSSRRFAVVMVVGAVLIAGCGDNDHARPRATPTNPAATATPTPTPVAEITYELVPVGDPENASDSTGYGGVPYEYRIGKYEVTIGQYTAFLNAVAKTDRYALYKPGMGGALNIAGIEQSGADGSYSYRIIPPSGLTPPGAESGSERPITYVSWFNAARFANWMANGQPTGMQDETTTEDGTYDLHGAVTGGAIAKNEINPNTGAPPSFYIPTENEWYKAAYYSPLRNDGAGGYYKVATQSDATPGNVLGDAANQANYISDTTGYSIYSVTQMADLDPNQNYLNDVGGFTGSASFYGTFDQTGNVWEWNDLDGLPGPNRIIRGGAWTSTPPYLRSTLRLGYAPDGLNSNSGFRLGGPAAVSASSTQPIAFAGLACGAFGLVRRRRGSRRRLYSMLGPTLAAIMALSARSDAAPAVTIDLVTISDAGNPHDSTGYGAVAYEYQIAKYDVTIGQYADFLNAVAAADPHALYNPSMATDLAIAGIARSGSDGTHTYSVIDNHGDSTNRPITYVCWWDAARFANWMANGQPTGAQDDTTTENGAYDLDRLTSGPTVARNVINPNTGAPPTFFVPLENEWYKAAYYDPTRDSGAGGYYDYATRTDAAPGNTIGGGENQANYFAGGKFSVTGGASQEPGENYLTDVGAFTNSPSFYGTYDQNGNVWQWNDLDGTPNTSRGLRGGYWFSGSLPLQSVLFCNDTAERESNDVGFRLAGPPLLGD